MASSIPDLTTVSSVPSNALFLLSYSGAPSQIVSFQDLLKNLTFVQSYDTNDLLLGVGNSSIPAIRISNSNKYVGISNNLNFSPLSILHVSGVTGSNTVFTIESPTGQTGYVRFLNQTGSWYIGQDNLNNFTISGTSPNDIYKNSFLIDHYGNVLITDGSYYVNSSLDTGVNIQFSVATGLKINVNDGTNSNDLSFTASGISSSKDLYLGYNTGTNSVSGSFFGLSGAVFVDKDDGTTRIGNTNRDVDARLMVSNSPIAGSPYKTMLVEDTGNAGLYFRQVGSTNTTSIIYNQPYDQIHFAKNKTSASVLANDPIIFDLGNKRIGVGGIDPTYPIDITGNGALISRFQTSSDHAFSRLQSNAVNASGPAVDYVATAYGSGDYNSFIIGYDFYVSSTSPSGPSGPSGPKTRLGQFFFQTGDSNNVYYPSRNIVTISDYGDINTKGIYTSDDNFCYGKFVDIHRASNVTGGAVYLNFDNIDYAFQTSGNVAYHSLLPASGRVIGVDFLCQLNSGMSNGTGYLVFNHFSGLTLTNANGKTYVSGNSTSSSKSFFQVWDAYTNAYKSSPSLTNFCYVSGIISGQGLLNLKARINDTTEGNKFRNSTSKLSFDRYDYGSWAAYALRDNGSGGTTLTPLTGAMNVTTMVEYFFASDTDSSNGTYVIQ